MAKLEDLERRVTNLEERLDMEAGLAASRDRDVADIKQTLGAHGRSIQALADTQSEHTATLAEHGRILAGHTQTLAEHGRKLDALGVGQETIIGMLDTLILRQDEGPGRD